MTTQLHRNTNNNNSNNNYCNFIGSTELLFYPRIGITLLSCHAMLAQTIQGDSMKLKISRKTVIFFQLDYSLCFETARYGVLKHNFSSSVLKLYTGNDCVYLTPQSYFCNILKCQRTQHINLNISEKALVCLCHLYGFSLKG